MLVRISVGFVSPSQVLSLIFLKLSFLFRDLPSAWQLGGSALFAFYIYAGNGTIPKPSPLGWSPENLLHTWHPPGARVKQGKTSAPSSQSLPLSCFKHILFPGIINQYLLFFPHHEHSLSPAGWMFLLTKQVLITHKLLYSSSWPGPLSLKEQP